MTALKQRYYVGLLSAAALHGAAHQAPHEFQVVTDKPTRAMVLGNARIFFITKKGMANTPTVPIKTPTGDVRVSTPEATALDLVRYPQHAGSLSNVATVLADLHAAALWSGPGVSGVGAGALHGVPGPRPADRPPAMPQKRGPKPRWSDAELLEEDPGGARGLALFRGRPPEGVGAVALAGGTDLQGARGG